MQTKLIYILCANANYLVYIIEISTYQFVNGSHWFEGIQKKNFTIVQTPD